jgi:hypothetical protein
MFSPSTSNKGSPTVLWTCIARNDTILVEAGEDAFDGSVSTTAKELLNREPTPGWEFHTQSRVNCSLIHETNVGEKKKLLKWPSGRGGQGGTHWRPQKLRGCKFHVYEKDCDGEYIVWVFACVYHHSIIQKDAVQSFLTKLVVDTDHIREKELEWLYGPTLACQESFGPTLRHYMMQVPHLAKISAMEKHMEAAREQMSKNIEMLLEREEKIEDLHQDATKLQEMATVFKKKAKHVRRAKMWQDAKHGLIMGTAITAGVAIVTVPPLIALL